MHRALFLCELHTTRKVALAKVRDFVRHDRRELVLGLGVLEQAAVNTDHSTRHCEGVDGRVVNDHQLDAAILKFTVLHQLENQTLQIAVHEGIVE